jgi:hypothetical protein
MTWGDRKYRGNHPSSDEGWGVDHTFGQDGGWVLYSRAQEHTDEWRTYKLVCAGEVTGKANFWFLASLIDGKPGRSADLGRLRKERPALHDALRDLLFERAREFVPGRGWIRLARWKEAEGVPWYIAQREGATQKPGFPVYVVCRDSLHAPEKFVVTWFAKEGRVVRTTEAKKLDEKHPRMAEQVKLELRALQDLSDIL